MRRGVYVCVERMIEGVHVFVCEGVWMCQWFHPVPVYRHVLQLICKTNSVHSTPKTQWASQHNFLQSLCGVFFFVGFFILSSTFCFQTMSCCIEEGEKMHAQAHTERQADAHQWCAKWCSCTPEFEQQTWVHNRRKCENYIMLASQTLC